MPNFPKSHSQKEQLVLLTVVPIYSVKLHSLSPLVYIVPSRSHNLQTGLCHHPYITEHSMLTLSSLLFGLRQWSLSLCLIALQLEAQTGVRQPGLEDEMYHLVSMVLTLSWTSFCLRLLIYELGIIISTSQWCSEN